MAKDRGYDKPWSTNARRTPAKSGKDPRRSSPSKAVDVDDLWGSKGIAPAGKRHAWKDANEVGTVTS